MFGRLNSTHKTPASSIFLQAAIAAVMVLSASFEALLIYIGFTLSLFAALTVVGLMRVRMAHGAEGKHYRTWGYPVTPLVFILCNLWIILFSIKSRPAAALTGLGTVAAGLVAYFLFDRFPQLKDSSAPAKGIMKAEP